MSSRQYIKLAVYCHLAVNEVIRCRITPKIKKSILAVAKTLRRSALHGCSALWVYTFVWSRNSKPFLLEDVEEVLPIESFTFLIQVTSSLFLSANPGIAQVFARWAVVLWRPTEIGPFQTDAGTRPGPLIPSSVFSGAKGCGTRQSFVIASETDNRSKMTPVVFSYCGEYSGLVIRARSGYVDAEVVHHRLFASC